MPTVVDKKRIITTQVREQNKAGCRRFALKKPKETPLTIVHLRGAVGDMLLGNDKEKMGRGYTTVEDALRNGSRVNTCVWN